MTNQEIKRTAKEVLINAFVIYEATSAKDINNECNGFSDMEVDEDKQRIQVDALFFGDGTLFNKIYGSKIANIK